MKSWKLRTKIGFLVILLVGGSIMGLGHGLRQIQAVNFRLQEQTQTYAPLNRLFAQLLSDAEVYLQELKKGMSSLNWSDPKWRPVLPPSWSQQMVESEWATIEKKLKGKPEVQVNLESIKGLYVELQAETLLLHRALSQRTGASRGLEEAAKLYPSWVKIGDQWLHEIRSASKNYERGMQREWDGLLEEISVLKASLEILILFGIVLALAILWIGGRAFQPLTRLTEVARKITQRGLSSSTKIDLSEREFKNPDEIGILAYEFHRMSTQLLERERMVEEQNIHFQRQNELLFSAQQLNEAVLSSTASLLLVTDVTGIILKANSRALRILEPQFPDHERKNTVLGANILEFELFKSIFSRTTKWEARAKALPLTEWNGRLFTGQTALLKKDSPEHGMILWVEDCTDQKSMEQRLAHAEQLAVVGRMSAQVAHEVRNPLHSMGLEAEFAFSLATKMEPRKPDLESAVLSIQEGIQRLEKITRNYLNYSKMSLGHKSWLKPEDLIEKTLTSFSPQFEKFEIQVDWTFGSGVAGLLQGDDHLLFQAFSNLVQNSIQALQKIQKPRRLTVTSNGTVQSGLYIRFEDNGPGIPDGVKSRIFQPFFTTKAEGTGLGLSFVKKVLEDHEGSIRHLSLSPQGACFEVRVPLFTNEEVSYVAEKHPDSPRR